MTSRDVDDRLRALAEHLDRKVAPIAFVDVRERLAGGPVPRGKGSKLPATAVVTVVLACVLAFVVAVVRDRDTIVAHRPSASTPAASTYRDDDGGFSMPIEPGWYRTDEPLTPWLVSPHELVSVATTPLTPVPEPGNQAACPSEIPTAAVEGIGRDGAYLWLGEWVPSAKGFGTTPPPRPRNFANANWEALCPLPDGITARGFTFTDSSRDFSVTVVFAPGASAKRRTEVYDMLDGLQFDEPATLVPVHGALALVGGPAPGSPRPVAGTVTATSATGRRFEADVRSDGTFTIELPPGPYEFTGTSPSFLDGTADACGGGRVDVVPFPTMYRGPGHRVSVVCPVK